MLPNGTSLRFFGKNGGYRCSAEAKSHTTSKQLHGGSKEKWPLPVNFRFGLGILMLQNRCPSMSRMSYLTYPNVPQLIGQWPRCQQEWKKTKRWWVFCWRAYCLSLTVCLRISVVPLYTSILTSEFQNWLQQSFQPSSEIPNSAWAHYNGGLRTSLTWS